LTDADLSEWSVQYSSAGGTTWQVTNLPHVTLAPGRHLLIQQAAGAGCSGAPCGQDLPTADASGNVALASNAGKVALVSSTEALSGACPLGEQVVDFVGYGSSANCFEGGGPAPAPSNTLSAFRKTDGCADTDDNATDFQAAAPAPRNTNSAIVSCSAAPTPTPTPTSTPTPSPTPSPTPTPTPSPSPSPTSTPTPTPTPSATPTPTPSPPLVVVSQVYGGAGCTTANCSAFKNDFVELYNRGATAVSLGGWSVQYASATGTGAWQVTTLGDFTLAPGQRYLVQEAGNANGVSSLPTPDATGSINMSATAGKVALVKTTTALSGSCPSGANVVDLVGYGSSASCSETAPAPAPGTNTAAVRKGDGCTDTGNNSSDFAAAPPNPRNTSAPAQTCPSTAAQNGTGESSRTTWVTLPPLFFFLNAYEFSEPRPSRGSKRWRRADGAYVPRGTRGGRPRPRGAWP
jgi:predicted extracellular nuclease